MTIRNSLLIFAAATALSACGSERPQPIPAVPEARQCPAFPVPPQDLMVPPAKTDFLPKTLSLPPKLL